MQIRPSTVARRCWAVAAALSLAAACACRPSAEAPRELTVFAAASTAELSTALARRFTAHIGLSARCSLAASSTLARQIVQGAQCDVYISANRRWVDHILQERDWAPERARPLAGNRLVVIAQRQAPQPPKPTLHAWLQGRVALADPRHVPAGDYARQALQRLGLWDAVAPQLVVAADVRAAVRLVELGEADAAIAYATDALHNPHVHAVWDVPSDSHDAVTYWVVRCSDRTAGSAFMALLEDVEIKALLHEHGFTSPSGTP